MFFFLDGLYVVKATTNHILERMDRAAKARPWFAFGRGDGTSVRSDPSLVPTFQLQSGRELVEHVQRHSCVLQTRDRSGPAPFSFCSFSSGSACPRPSLGLIIKSCFSFFVSLSIKSLPPSETNRLPIMDDNVRPDTLPKTKCSTSFKTTTGRINQL